MLFVPLDVNWPDNVKVMTAGLDGAGLHATALCLSKRLGTDGVLYRAHLERYGATPELIDRLLEVGLFDPVDDRRISVHKWLEYNASSADLEATSEAGRRGNHKRWRHRGSFDSCKICNGDPPQSPRSVAPSSPPDSPPDRPPDSPPDRGGESPPDRLVRDEVRDEVRDGGYVVAAANAASLATAEGRQQLWKSTARVIAERRAALAGDKGPGWIRAAARGIERDRHQEAHARILNLPPDADPTPEELADMLEPPPTPPRPPGPSAEEQALADTRAAFAERAERNQARDNGAPERVVGRNLTGIEAARGSIRSAFAEIHQGPESPQPEETTDDRPAEPQPDAG